MRIAFIIGHLGIGGTQRQISYLVRILTEKNVSVHVVCTSKKCEPFATYLSRQGIFIHQLKYNNIITRILRLLLVLRNIKPDIIHSFGDYAGIFAVFASKVLHITHLNSVRNLFSHYNMLTQFIRFLILFNVDMITANSYALMQHLKERPLKSSIPLRYIPNGIDIPGFTHMADFGLKKISISNDGFKILYVGRNHLAKDIPTLVRTLNFLDQMLDKYSFKVNFIAVGEGLEGVVKNQLMSFNNIEVAAYPQIFDIGYLYILCDLVILTSKSESMPNVLMEAAAAGKPAVCTNAGGCSEVVVNCYTGLVVSIGDAQAMASGILKLLTNKSLSKRMGNNAYNRIQREFSMQTVYELYRTTYETLLKY